MKSWPFMTANNPQTSLKGPSVWQSVKLEWVQDESSVHSMPVSFFYDRMPFANPSLGYFVTKASSVNFVDYYGL